MCLGPSHFALVLFFSSLFLADFNYFSFPQQDFWASDNFFSFFCWGGGHSFFVKILNE